MSAIVAPVRVDLRERLARVRARGGALVTDTLLLLYVAWAVDVLAAGPAGATGPLPEAGTLALRPALLLVAPLLALLWEATGASWGQRGWGATVLDRGGAGAGADRRAWRGLLATLLGALALFPAALGMLGQAHGRDPGFHVVLSLAMTGVLLLAGLLDPLGRGLVDRLAGTFTATPPPAPPGPRPSAWRRPDPWAALLVLGLTFAVGFRITGFDLGTLAQGAERTRHLWGRLLQPDWDIAGRVVERMVETVFLALMASVLALPFAFVLAFLGARNVTRGTVAGRAAYVAARVLMNVVRSIEPLVWVIVFSLWVFAGPFAGTLALLVHSVAALGKLYSEAVEATDPGPVEAIQATGANALQTLRYGVVPQVVPPFLSFTIYRWDINVRMATVLGLAGGGGIGDLLIGYQQLGAWSKVGTILLFVTLVVWAMDWASSKARERLV